MKSTTLILGAAVALGLTAAPAIAHQTVTSNGARVTLHVNPDDAPEAGVPSSIRVLSVKVPSRSRFAFRTCRCAIRITDSAGRVVMSRSMKTSTTFTFPRAGGYQITYSGKYTRSGRTKRFAAKFAIRAS